MNGGYSTNEVAGITGLSLRQLQWWDERGIVQAARDGHNRVYSEVHVRYLRILAELNRKGLSAGRLRKLLPLIRNAWPHGPAHGMYLVTDGEAMVAIRTATTILPVLTNMYQAAYVVAL